MKRRRCLGLGRVAFKAVDLDCGIGMAALAKIFIAADDRIGFLAGMALDAVLKAVLGGANAFVHRLVALMHQEFHVVLAHVVGVFDAALALARLDHRLRYAGLLNGSLLRRAGRQRKTHPRRREQREWCYKTSKTHTLFAHTHLDVAGRANVGADMASDATVIVGIDVAARGRLGLFNLKHSDLRTIHHAVVALEA